MHFIHRSGVFIVVVFILAATLLAQPPDKVLQNIRVVNSVGAKGDIDPEKLQQCFWHLLQQQGLSEQEPPRVLVLHVSQAEAEVAGIRDNIVRFEAIAQGRTYYQVWLVDKFSSAQYVVAFQAIIRQAFGLRTSALDEDAVLARVMKIQNATISARQR